MIFVPKILFAGAGDKANALQGLPVQMYVTTSGGEAIRCLKKRRIDTVISRWQLIDIKNGEFLRAVIEARPGISSIAIINAGDYVQEVAARSVGVTAVLPENVDDGHFRKTVCLISGAVEPPDDETKDYEIDGIKYVAVSNI
jgi:DNA-binding NtrC family response regulator